MKDLISRKKVCVVGLGYIGLPTASLLASKGYFVHGVDVNPLAVEKINKGQAHIVEPDLDVLVKAAVNSGKLKANLKPEKSDIFILAVPTPFKENHKPDISYVESAVDSIVEYLSVGNIVILESTSPVGTTELVAKRILDKRSDLKIAQKDNEQGIFVAYCPERVLPGSILKELIENDRIVGGITEASTNAVVEFYKTFVKGEILVTNSRTAELSKLTENAYRDVNIAFANELGRICDHLNIDVWKLISLANHHPRVKILRPGPGVGGHCIAVDPWFIVDAAPEQTSLIRSTRMVNDSQPHYVFDKVKKSFTQLKLQNMPIALLGLSYKPDIDDLRESPAVEVVKLVAEAFDGAILVSEPNVDVLPSDLISYKNVTLAKLEKVLSEAGLIVILVNHKDYKNIYQMNSKKVQIIDTVGIGRST